MYQINGQHILENKILSSRKINSMYCIMQKLCLNQLIVFEANLQAERLRLIVSTRFYTKPPTNDFFSRILLNLQVNHLKVIHYSLYIFVINVILIIKDMQINKQHADNSHTVYCTSLPDNAFLTSMTPVINDIIY